MQIVRRCLWIVLCILAAASEAAQPGAGKSASTARVLIVRDPSAVELFTPQPAIVRGLFDRGLLLWTRTNSTSAAWRSLLSSNDTVGIKVYTSPGPSSGTRIELTSSIVRSLLEAGHPASRIIVWDRNESDLREAGYLVLAERFGITVAASTVGGYDEKHFYDTSLIGNLVWGDHEFGKKGDTVGRKSFISKLVTSRMTKIISVAPMLNHNQAGVAGHLYSVALGSVDNIIRFENSRERLAVATPEIYGTPILADRVVLNITDARLHNSVALQELRFSKDPVALDVLSLEELERQRKVAQLDQPKGAFELYSNAALLELGVAERSLIRIESGP